MIEVTLNYNNVFNIYRKVDMSPLMFLLFGYLII